MTEDHGVIVAALTPRGKKGELDFGAAFELIDRLCAARVRGIALFTAAGEYPAFSLEERTRLLYLAVKRSRVPLYAGAGSIGLDDSLTLAREARRAGAQGVFLPPPHFFPYMQEEIREFYVQFACQLGGGIPAYLANTPDVTSEITLETAHELLATGQFAGIEDPAVNASFFASLPVSYLSGDDRPAESRRGAHGVLSSVARSRTGGMTPRCTTETGIMRLIWDRCLTNFSWGGQFPFPVLVKVAASLRGFKPGAQSVPLSPGRQHKLDAFREWFQGWLPALKRL
jgi:dihydrodipicolinate synthase/N-acetylneuraminate lyase